MAKRSMISADSVLVTCRPGAYYRDKGTGRVFTGPQGTPGSAKFREGSGAFRVSRVRFDRDAGLPGGQRIFTRVGEADDAQSET